MGTAPLMARSATGWSKENMSTPATTQRSLERHIRQLLLLQETAKKVNSILDLEQLFDEIVGGVAEAFGCNRTAVLLKEDTTDELEIVARRGFINVHYLKGYRFKITSKETQPGTTCCDPKPSSQQTKVSRPR
jgi:transcriptional regulator with GAF, ATPase, and Fis domain